MEFSASGIPPSLPLPLKGGGNPNIPTYHFAGGRPTGQEMAA
jgi:hypothetical protein